MVSKRVLAAIYESCRLPTLSWLMRKMSLAPAEADDALHDAVIIFQRTYDRRRGRALSYMIHLARGIVLNRIKHEGRARANAAEAHMRLAPPVEDPDREERDASRKAAVLSRLRGRRYTVARMAFEGVGVGEMAETLGLSRGRLYHVMSEIRREFE